MSPDFEARSPFPRGALSVQPCLHALCPYVGLSLGLASCSFGRIARRPAVNRDGKKHRNDRNRLLATALVSAGYREQDCTAVGRGTVLVVKICYDSFDESA